MTVEAARISIGLASGNSFFWNQTRRFPLREKLMTHVGAGRRSSSGWEEDELRAAWSRAASTPGAVAHQGIAHPVGA